MGLMQEIGDRLRKARGKASLREICSQLEGMSVTRLSNYENGTRLLPVEEAKRLAPVLKTTAEYLLTLTDEEPDPREIQLISLFRACDDRGRLATLDIAKQQASFVQTKAPTQDSVDSSQPETLKSDKPQERRSGPAKGPKARSWGYFEGENIRSGDFVPSDHISGRKRKGEDSV